MSRELEAADIAGIGQLSRDCAGAARELTRQSGALDSLAARMRGGAWVSPAGSAFLAKTGEQARRLRISSGLAEQLGAALQVLAADLGAARADATLAVAEGRRLDTEAQELNARVRAQHALAPHDPDAMLISETSAQDLLARMAGAWSRLAGADDRARAAWRRAHAALDGVRYATPQVRE